MRVPISKAPHDQRRMLDTRAESSAVTSSAPATAAATIPSRRRIGNANGRVPAVVAAGGPNSVERAARAGGESGGA